MVKVTINKEGVYRINDYINTDYGLFNYINSKFTKNKISSYTIYIDLTDANIKEINLNQWNFIDWNSVKQLHFINWKVETPIIYFNCYKYYVQFTKCTLPLNIKGYNKELGLLSCCNYYSNIEINISNTAEFIQYIPIMLLNNAVVEEEFKLYNYNNEKNFKLNSFSISTNKLKPINI
jgi:hypothetical protein